MMYNFISLPKINLKILTMKKVKQIGFIMLMGISTAMINGCAKDGATGPAGVAGTNGVDGNANVHGGNTVSVASSQWVLSGTYYTTLINSSAITQAIVNNGAVIVYEQFGTSWQCLPYTIGLEERDFTFAVGSYKIWTHNTDGSTPTNPGAQIYRAVVISASNLIAHPNVDFKNYQMVKTTFGLPN